MGNKEIAKQFSLLAALMELHGENAFKTKAYANAYLALRKWDRPLTEMSEKEIEAIPGIGASVANKIAELNDKGKITVLEEWKAKTPEGIQQLLSVKGLGPKKVRQIWDELKTESPAELLYACQENRLVNLQGFGLKTQEDLIQKLEYFLESQHQLLYGHVEEELAGFLSAIRKAFPGHRIEWVGEMARFCPVIDQLELLTAPAFDLKKLSEQKKVTSVEQGLNGTVDLVVEDRFKVRVYSTEKQAFSDTWCKLTMRPELFQKVGRQVTKASEGAEDFVEILLAPDGPFPPPELFDKDDIENKPAAYWTDLIQKEDLRGIIHNHSTWSDGIHTLEEMAIHVRDAGYEYFAICDHSRSAFYANGLSAERVIAQMEEIDALNKRLAPFRIFKGIESDILGDGALDYEDEILSKFDLIVASVHSNLRMDQEKAMSRLITAIENPHTHILGHPTGRLLLARKGYPIDHRKIIDACAANRVAIELNANPLRLDMDYQWMDYCMEKDVWVSINPDAHARGQVAYVKYGVLAARKGGLKKSFCLNALSLKAFESWLSKKK
jgi:DNA polymerase (family 10)